MSGDFFAAVAQFRKSRVVLEHVDPIGLRHLLAHLGRAHTRRIGTRHQRPHAGARHTGDWHTQALKHLKDANVGRAPGTTSAQHQTNSGTLRGPWFFRTPGIDRLDGR